MTNETTVADWRKAEARKQRHLSDIARVLDRAEAEHRGLSATEQTRIDELRESVTRIEDELDAAEHRNDPVTAWRRANPGQQISPPDYTTAGLSTSAVSYTASRGGVYTPESRSSYFLDRFEATRGDFAAAERLDRHAREFRDLAAHHNAPEVRALSTTTGAGGDFSPPAWLLDDWIAALRPSRATAAALTNELLPEGASTLNVPKIATGTTVAVQGTNNVAISQTDPTTALVSAPVYTVAGGAQISQQLIDQSGITGGFDRLIMDDLAADYARGVGFYVMNGTGSGQPTGLLTAATTTVTYTDGTPAFAGTGKLFGKIASAMATIQTTRYQGPTAIVLHPRRWAWIATQVDTANRPMIVPEQNGPNNAAGVITVSGAAQGIVGSILGIPVIADPQIPTNQGTGTNQDVVLVGRLTDSMLWEQQPRIEAFAATYAPNLSVFIRLYNYVAIAHRYTQSLVQITGTGLVTPAF